MHDNKLFLALKCSQVVYDAAIYVLPVLIELFIFLIGQTNTHSCCWSSRFAAPKMLQRQPATSSASRLYFYSFSSKYAACNMTFTHSIWPPLKGSASFWTLSQLTKSIIIAWRLECRNSSTAAVIEIEIKVGHVFGSFIFHGGSSFEASPHSRLFDQKAAPLALWP